MRPFLGFFNMQTLFFFCLLTTIAYIQCRPSEQPAEATGEAVAADVATVEEKDFCTDLREDDQLLFLGCLSQMVPEAKKVMEDKGENVQSILSKICGENGEAYQREMMEALVVSDDAIDKCSQLIQMPTV
uniref:Putative secreted protein n=1 Tax=Amblyomma americanum TaxID=6943 RepID=A0A0C9SDI6_AMBAM